jgi:hypothetical protein
MSTSLLQLRIVLIIVCISMVVKAFATWVTQAVSLSNQLFMLRSLSVCHSQYAPGQGVSLFQSEVTDSRDHPQ